MYTSGLPACGNENNQGRLEGGGEGEVIPALKITEAKLENILDQYAGRITPETYILFLLIG